MANQTSELSARLREAGLDVTVLRTNAPYAPAWVGRAWGVRALFRLVPYAARLLKLSGSVDVLHVMANSGWSWHLCAAPAVWAGVLRGTPVVVNYRGGQAEEFLARSARWVRPTLARAKLVVPSRFLQRVFARYGFAAEIVPNAVDAELFSPPTRGIEARPAEGRYPHLVVTRNLEAIYDIPTALETLARVRQRFPRARMTVAGDGPERPALVRLAAELGIAAAVEFPGRLGRESIARLYRSADLMLNPSRVDNMPNSVLEALACGLPVVTTDAGGIPDMVEPGVEALLVGTGDPRAMADAACRILEDPELAARLSAEGRRKAAAHSWASVTAAWHSVYATRAGDRLVLGARG
jgi:glycosyltransferase involved in cell wall biosynthesis